MNRFDFCVYYSVKRTVPARICSNVSLLCEMNINRHLITFDLVSSIAIARNEIPRTDESQERRPSNAINRSKQ